MKRILTLTLFLGSLNLFAADLSGKVGLGFSGSYPVPSFGNDFNEAIEERIGYGANLRYHYSSN